MTLSVAARGTAPFTYRWYKDGALIADATSPTYVISRARTVDAGTYFAVVTNAAGSTVSDQAILTVDGVAAATALAGGATAVPASPAGPPPADDRAFATHGRLSSPADPVGMADPATVGGSGPAATGAGGTVVPGGSATLWRRAAADTAAAGDWRVIRIDSRPDGETDIIWQDATSGQVELWVMDDATLVEVIPLADIPPEEPPAP